MKKVLKALSIASLVSVLAVTSGCKASQKKVNEVSANLATSNILSVGGEATDFVAIYERSETKNDVVEKTVITVKRDVKNDIFVLETLKSSGKVDEELEEQSNDKHKVYVEDGKVYIKDMNDKDSTPVSVNYSFPYYVYENSGSLANAGLTTDYFEYTSRLYDKYKTVPFNACASNGVKADVTDIFVGSSELLECKTDKAVFKNEYTYNIGYNISLIQWNEVTMTVNKEGMMTKLEVVEKFSNGSSNSFSLSINYKDIDLTK